MKIRKPAARCCNMLPTKHHRRDDAEGNRRTAAIFNFVDGEMGVDSLTGLRFVLFFFLSVRNAETKTAKKM